MKNFYPLLILALLAACQSTQEKQYALANDTIAASEVQPADTMLKGTVIATDPDAYGSRVPYPLQRYIEREMPGYSIPAWKRFPDTPESELPPPGGIGPVVHGDWNCDAFKDYAVVLESPAHRVRTYVFVADKGSFTRDTIGFALDLPDTTAPVGYYLMGGDSAENPVRRSLPYTDYAPGMLPSMCDFVRIEIPQKSARDWYWNDKTKRWDYLQAKD